MYKILLLILCLVFILSGQNNMISGEMNNNKISEEKNNRIDGQLTDQFIETEQVTMNYKEGKQVEKVFEQADLSKKRVIIQKQTDPNIEGKIKFENQMLDLPDLIMHNDK